ncbi:MAG: glycine zipper 2TM domain-containing protein [Magnetococcales bacterium]|nr:glycine zipper 2TM domain-containing protein [Magnetococcales bacterium]
MKRTGVWLAMTAAMGMMVNSGVVWAGSIDPLGGMITGALVGSVFGPDKKHRTKNALIGAVAGAFLGSQVSYAQDQSASGTGYAYVGGYRGDDDDWDRRHHDRRHHRHHHHTTTIIERVPSQQTVVVTPRYDDEETVVVTRYGNTKVIVVDPPETRSYIHVTPAPRGYTNFGYGAYTTSSSY